jgi:UDP-N-acetylmuramyl pentapeptide phosphotransferase/UDP-N-acetylglucosamine-1-phosphate transferase
MLDFVTIRSSACYGFATSGRDAANYNKPHALLRRGGGALLGFSGSISHPAGVFMGDVGSFALAARWLP